MPMIKNYHFNIFSPIERHLRPYYKTWTNLLPQYSFLYNTLNKSRFYYKAADVFTDEGAKKLATLFEQSLFQYGLYSSFVGCFIYIVFGSCKDITLGPTALLALMTYEQLQGRNFDYAVLLCFLTGIIQLVMGLLHLGNITQRFYLPDTSLHSKNNTRRKLRYLFLPSMHSDFSLMWKIM